LDLLSQNVFSNIFYLYFVEFLGVECADCTLQIQGWLQYQFSIFTVGISPLGIDGLLMTKS
jgi:hypothetical protein